MWMGLHGSTMIAKVSSLLAWDNLLNFRARFVIGKFDPNRSMIA